MENGLNSIMPSCNSSLFVTFFFLIVSIVAQQKTAKALVNNCVEYPIIVIKHVPFLNEQGEWKIRKEYATREEVSLTLDTVDMDKREGPLNNFTTEVDKTYVKKIPTYKIIGTNSPKYFNVYVSCANVDCANEKNSSRTCLKYRLSWEAHSRSCDFFSAGNAKNFLKAMEEKSKFIVLYCGIEIPDTHTTVSYDSLFKTTNISAADNESIKEEKKQTIIEVQPENLPASDQKSTTQLTRRIENWLESLSERSIDLLIAANRSVEGRRLGRTRGRTRGIIYPGVLRFDEVLNGRRKPLPVSENERYFKFEMESEKQTRSVKPREETSPEKAKKNDQGRQPVRNQPVRWDRKDEIEMPRQLESMKLNKDLLSFRGEFVPYVKKSDRLFKMEAAPPKSFVIQQKVPQSEQVQQQFNNSRSKEEDPPFSTLGFAPSVKKPRRMTAEDEYTEQEEREFRQREAAQSQDPKISVNSWQPSADPKQFKFTAENLGLKNAKNRDISNGFASKYATGYSSSGRDESSGGDDDEQFTGERKTSDKERNSASPGPKITQNQQNEQAEKQRQMLERVQRIVDQSEFDQQAKIDGRPIRKLKIKPAPTEEERRQSGKNVRFNSGGDFPMQQRSDSGEQDDENSEDNFNDLRRSHQFKKAIRTAAENQYGPIQWQQQRQDKGRSAATAEQIPAADEDLSSGRDEFSGGESDPLQLSSKKRLNEEIRALGGVEAMTAETSDVSSGRDEISGGYEPDRDKRRNRHSNQERPKDIAITAPSSSGAKKHERKKTSVPPSDSNTVDDEEREKRISDREVAKRSSNRIDRRKSHKSSSQIQQEELIPRNLSPVRIFPATATKTRTTKNSEDNAEQLSDEVATRLKLTTRRKSKTIPERWNTYKTNRKYYEGDPGAGPISPREGRGHLDHHDYGSDLLRRTRGAEIEPRQRASPTHDLLTKAVKLLDEHTSRERARIMFEFPELTAANKGRKSPVGEKREEAKKKEREGEARKVSPEGRGRKEIGRVSPDKKGKGKVIASRSVSPVKEITNNLSPIIEDQDEEGTREGSQKFRTIYSSGHRTDESDFDNDLLFGNKMPKYKAIQERRKRMMESSRQKAAKIAKMGAEMDYYILPFEEELKHHNAKQSGDSSSAVPLTMKSVSESFVIGRPTLWEPMPTLQNLSRTPGLIDYRVPDMIPENPPNPQQIVFAGEFLYRTQRTSPPIVFLRELLRVDYQSSGHETELEDNRNSGDKRSPPSGIAATGQGSTLRKETSAEIFLMGVYYVKPVKGTFIFVIERDPGSASYFELIFEPIENARNAKWSSTVNDKALQTMYDTIATEKSLVGNDRFCVLKLARVKRGNQMLYIDIGTVQVEASQNTGSKPIGKVQRIGVRKDDQWRSKNTRVQFVDD